jgi:hypothetical protein
MVPVKSALVLAGGGVAGREIGRASAAQVAAFWA